MRMNQEVLDLNKIAEMRKVRILARIADFQAFCLESLDDGMGEDLDDSAFLESAMTTYLDVCTTHAADEQDGK